MKTARILDEDNDGFFGLEYDNGRGTKSTMRLEAATYEKAVREAKSFLEIKDDDHDGDGNQWEVA